MPYKLDCNKDGCYVINKETGKRKNKKRMPKLRANRYMKALYAAENQESKKEYDTGAMAAFFLPEEQAKELALPIGVGETEPLGVDDLHITLCYFGDTETDDLNRESIENAIKKFTKNHAPINGVVNGYGRFTNEDSDKSPIYATFDSPNLPEFRQDLIDEFENNDIEYKRDHGFTPHITLAYFPADEKVNLPGTPVLPIRFGSIVLTWGDERTEFKLQGKEEETMKEFIEEFLLSNKKELSLDEKLNHIRDEIRKKFNPPMGQDAVAINEPYYWVQYIYEGYAIINKDEEYFRVNYTVDDDGNVAIGDIQEVEMAWVLASKDLNVPLYSSPKPGEEDPASDHLMVFKEKSGDYRWIMFSSNAFQDRDGEIVSLKALTDDVARADEDGLYGPLRWWHIGDPDPATKSAGPGLDIGDCDFNCMHGKILIESGTFRDQEVGEIIAKKASELQGSILFFHPQSEPDDEGVFHNIHRAERSLLPKGKASNSLVSLLVAKKESDMSKITEKIQKFIEKLGGDEEKVQEALEHAELTEKDADALGLTWKGDDPDPKGEPAGEEPEGDEPAGDDPEGEEKKILGDMTLKQFQEILQANLGETVQPLAVQLKEIQTAQAKVDDTQISLKEAVDNQSKRQEDMDKRLKELEGETPRSRDGYRPSQDGDTVIDDEHSLKGVKPGMDPEFMQFVLPGEKTG